MATTFNPSMLTWDTLVRLEPCLASLLAEARAVRDNRRGKVFCANAVWYGYGGWPGFKPRLLRLVGHERLDGDRVLTSSAAYDIASETLYDALPDCRGPCLCM